MLGSAIAWLTCLSYGFMPTPVFPVECGWQQSLPLEHHSSNGQSRVAPWLERRARAITVRVKLRQYGGSGILIARQGRLYTVVTNRHVITPGAPYVIQTPDGRSHPATLGKKFNFRGTDLAILQFTGSGTYAIAPLSRTSQLLEGTPVIAAGFPIDPVPHQGQGLLLTTGQISLLPPQPFQGGYQIGYTNLIRQGMSGGPVLNLQGEVIGINSLHAYPLWGDPYIFQDGSKLLPAQRQQVIQSSWAVPIARVREAIGL